VGLHRSRIDCILLQLLLRQYSRRDAHRPVKLAATGSRINVTLPVLISHAAPLGLNAITTEPERLANR
jgi:hypothetical protein